MSYHNTSNSSPEQLDKLAKDNDRKLWGGAIMFGLLCLGALGILAAPKSPPNNSQNVGVFSKTEYDYMNKKFEIEKDKDNYRKSLNK